MRSINTVFSIVFRMFGLYRRALKCAKLFDFNRNLLKSTLVTGFANEGDKFRRETSASLYISNFMVLISVRTVAYRNQ